MERKKMKTTVIGAIILPSLIFLTGCATISPSSNTKRAEKTTESMEVVEKDINRISVQLSATEASIDNLLNANESEIEDAFEIYQENVDKVVNLKTNLGKHTDNMRSNGNEYFTQWQSEGETYESPELRDVSTQRREELSRTFSQITESSGRINRELQAYVNHAKEIESYLENDLTPKGIKAVTPLTQSVIADGKKLKSAINSMQNSIAATKPEMRRLARN